MENHIRVHYPYYTKLLMTIFECINNIGCINDPEY